MDNSKQGGGCKKKEEKGKDQRESRKERKQHQIWSRQSEKVGKPEALEGKNAKNKNKEEVGVETD